MFLVVELFRWWYTDGWKQRTVKMATNLEGTLDYFSMDLLIKTLFQPFRQISTGSVDGPLEVKLRAMLDRLFSRIIGAIIRILLMLTGIIALLLQTLLTFVVLLGWALVPVLPVVGMVLAIVGVKIL